MGQQKTKPVEVLVQTMGQVQGTAIDFTSYRSIVSATETGEEILSCSLSRWVKGTNTLCGFDESVNYDQVQEGFTGSVYGLWADVTEGRCLKAEMKSASEIWIKEDKLHHVYQISVPPCFTSGKVRWTFPSQELASRGRRPDENHVVLVIGCRGRLGVIQVLNKVDCFIPEFYLIDLEEARCIGKASSIEMAELMWYESYISPDCSQVVLRPLYSLYNTTVVEASDIYSQTVGDIEILAMTSFPDAGGFALCFDNRYGNRFMFRGKKNTVELYDLSEKEVVQASGQLTLPAPIRQLKSSPSGSHLALRCVYPNFSPRLDLNAVVVLATDSLQVLFTLGAGDRSNALQSAVNIRIFPCFSGCDSTIAISRKQEATEHVYLYKLPALFSSLQHICRRVIRQNCLSCNLDRLDLPTKLVDYLRYSWT